MPGLGKVGVTHLQSPEGWTACAALAAAGPAAIAAWHAARPKKAPTVDLVTQLAAALRAALAPGTEAAGGEQQRSEQREEAEEDSDSDGEGSDSDDDADEDEELEDDELDAGEHESDTSCDDTDDEGGE